MEYDLGVIGLGHWFKWLRAGIGSKGGLHLKKAAGTRPFDDKKDMLTNFGMAKQDYYIADSNGKVPEQFFDDISIVHISDPNRFHAIQIMDSLKHGKYVITEKTFAVNHDQFKEVEQFIRSNGYEGKAYLHLHYLHKQPTIALKAMLPDLVMNNGRIKSIDATFFEEINEEDPRRTWLLDISNGGIFMDWIHPYEVIYYSTSADFGRIKKAANFVTNPSYNETSPTGVEVIVEVNGINYSKDATATVRAAKGVEKKYANKSIRFTFESGNYLIMCFPGHYTFRLSRL